MTAVAHTVRNDMLSKERSFSVEGGSLHWRDVEGEGAVAFGDIREVALISYAGSGGRHLQCTIRPKSGSKLLVRSHHFKSVGLFKDRRATYRDFVRALCSQVAAANSSALFITGNTGLRLLWIVVMVLTAAITCFILALAMAEMLDFGAAIVPLLMSAGGAVFSFHFVRKMKQTSFDPHDPPVS